MTGNRDSFKGQALSSVFGNLRIVREHRRQGLTLSWLAPIEATVDVHVGTDRRVLHSLTTRTFIDVPDP